MTSVQAWIPIVKIVSGAVGAAGVADRDAGCGEVAG